MSFYALRSRRITCSCFSLEENHGKNGERWTPSSWHKRLIFRKSAWSQEASGSEGPTQFVISHFFTWTFMEWELIDVWVNMCPGHERFVNSLHPIMSFLKKVPPLIARMKWKSRRCLVLWCQLSFSGGSWHCFFQGTVGTSLPDTMDFAAYRVKVRSVFHWCSQVLPLTTVGAGTYPNL